MKRRRRYSSLGSTESEAKGWTAGGTVPVCGFRVMYREHLYFPPVGIVCRHRLT